MTSTTLIGELIVLDTSNSSRALVDMNDSRLLS